MILSLFIAFCFFVKCEAFDLSIIEESKVILTENVSNKSFIDNVELAETSNKAYLIFKDYEKFAERIRWRTFTATHNKV